MGLKKYHEKRNFKRTPEPSGKKNVITKKPIFVIQKHDASHLHYDLRLECNGVLKSWAVPKGPSLDPNEKHLAIEVEDHPFDYRNFEGVIPKDNYGAGTVMIWDEGTYTLEEPSKNHNKEFIKAYNSGKISFIVQGKKLHGLFTLVKTKGEKTWLLIKKKDAYAQTQDILLQNTSVRSGKSLPLIKLSEEIKDIKLEEFPGIKKSKITLLRPMLATKIHEPFSNSDWIFEIKWDGYRALAYCRDSIKLYSRNQILLNPLYPDVVEELKMYLGSNTIFDGELVTVDEKGIPKFQWLQNYSTQQEGHLIYYIFDILHFGDYDFRNVPLLKRKEFLRRVLEDSNHIKYCDHIFEDGIDFFNALKQQEVEGVIAKHAQSSYVNHRSRNWLKIKQPSSREAFIIGFTEPQKSRKYFGSLLLAIPVEGKLVYAGNVGTGFKEKDLAELYQQLLLIKTQNPPNVDRIPIRSKKVTWVKPQLVCLITFTETTDSGSFRHPVFISLIKDKKFLSFIHPIKKSAVAQSFSHVDKVYFPQNGFTKADILKYYESVGDFLIPYLKKRPQSLHRFPNGIQGEDFFQKDVDFKVPDFVNTHIIYSESGNKYINYIVCNNIQALLFMVNLGCIEINPWLSTIDHLEYPDFGVLDIDPNGVNFSKVIEIAKLAHELCKSANIQAFCKTSGASGLHIYIPMQAQYTYPIVTQFILLLATLIHHELPQFTSLERSPAKRRKKVYLDYLQNRRGQTIAAPLSVRPLVGAPVSTPLDWSEVNAKLKPTKFHIKNVHRRLKEVGDLFAPVLKLHTDIEQAIQRLEKLFT